MDLSFESNDSNFIWSDRFSFWSPTSDVSQKRIWLGSPECYASMCWVQSKPRNRALLLAQVTNDCLQPANLSLALEMVTGAASRFQLQSSCVELWSFPQGKQSMGRFSPDGGYVCSWHRSSQELLPQPQDSRRSCQEEGEYWLEVWMRWTDRSCSDSPPARPQMEMARQFYLLSVLTWQKLVGWGIAMILPFIYNFGQITLTLPK